MTMSTNTKISGDNLQNAIIEIKRNRGQISSNWLENAPSKVTRQWRLRILMMNLSKFSPDFTFSFSNLLWEFVLLFMSYFLLWSSKVMFCDDRSKKKATNIATSHFYFSNISDIEMTMTGAEKMRQLFPIFTHSILRSPKLETSDTFLSSYFHFYRDRSGKKATTVLCTHFHFLDDRRLSYNDRSKKTN